MRATTLLTLASVWIATAQAAGFHILTAACIEKTFSKRSSISRFDTTPDGHLDDAAAFEAGHDENQPQDSELIPRQKIDKPATWHESGRRTTVSLMPSSQFGCDYLQKHELGLSGLPDSHFYAGNFCGHNLDFWKKGNKWEVWENNQGIKHGECYEDPSSMECNLWVGLFQEKCNWTRRYVCAMNICN